MQSFETVVLPIVEVKVNPLTVVQIVDLIHDSVTDGRTTRIANLNLHGLFYWTELQSYREFVDSSDVVLIDGWPILALARLKRKGLGAQHRVGSTDWVAALLEDPRSLKVCAVGGTPAVAIAAAAYVDGLASQIEWSAVDGYGGLDEGNFETVKELISSADLVLVGMGMPRQEAWIQEHADLLIGKVVANVGGCLDYMAGAQDLAPRWTGAVGLEWFYRLVKSPRRLFHRYTVEPFLLLRNVVIGSYAARGRRG